MEIKKCYSGSMITGLSSEQIDLFKTFNCGQCFRWKTLSNGIYSGIINNRIILLKENINEYGKLQIETNFNTQDCKNIIIPYLGLNIDYDRMFDRCSLDDFAMKAEKFSRGIRILRQDPWETLISFIISQRNNIPKIISTIEKMCTVLGNRVEYTAGKTKYIEYSFPDCKTIVDAGINGLQGLGLGYRDKFIYNAALAVESGSINLEYINSGGLDGDETLNVLEQLYGVGPKVANCVALFGFGELDRFPIDVWIQKIIDTYYNGNIDISKYGSAAGLIQQYMFYYIKNI